MTWESMTKYGDVPHGFLQMDKSVFSQDGVPLMKIWEDCVMGKLL